MSNMNKIVAVHLVPESIAFLILSFRILSQKWWGYIDVKLALFCGRRKTFCPKLIAHERTNSTKTLRTKVIFYFHLTNSQVKSNCHHEHGR